jgi:excisionase family DNA binding protein
LVERDLLRAADIAPLLGITTGRVYQLIADGAIPAVRVGGAIRIPRRAWDEWLTRKKRSALASLRPASRAVAETKV